MKKKSVKQEEKKTVLSSMLCLAQKQNRGRASLRIRKWCFVVLLLAQKKAQKKKGAPFFHALSYSIA